MTLGGFTASVRITSVRLSGGLDDRGMPCVRADMEFEGKLLVFHYRDLKETLKSKTKCTVSVEIEFKEKKEVEPHFFRNREKQYIGTIQLFENQDEKETKDEANAIVRVALPISMLPPLQAMKDDVIKFETIHDLVREPDTHQKADCIVALVKRIYFEPFIGEGSGKHRKTFSISFG